MDLFPTVYFWTGWVIRMWTKKENSDPRRQHISGKLPDTYEEFADQFSFEDLDGSTPLLYNMLEKIPDKTIDWLFRLYSLYYNHVWDPHYYTSLYSATNLYMGDEVRDVVACRMALEQALKYFAGSIA